MAGRKAHQRKSRATKSPRIPQADRLAGLRASDVKVTAHAALRADEIMPLSGHAAERSCR
jgi:hypothetical protein